MEVEMVRLEMRTQELQTARARVRAISKQRSGVMLLLLLDRRVFRVLELSLNFGERERGEEATNWIFVELLCNKKIRASTFFFLAQSWLHFLFFNISSLNIFFLLTRKQTNFSDQK